MTDGVNSYGGQIPGFIYGTAWKGKNTRRLTRLALESGFRGLDTANQPKHYYEPGVGEALADLLDAGAVERNELFVQSKFTHLSSQGESVPYDPEAGPRAKVKQSLDSSLSHLGLERLDSYLLHGPRARRGLDEVDREVWRAMEKLTVDGKVKRLGISNVSPNQLDELLDFAEVKPAFVQNRCFARTGWDGEVRKLCSERDLVYQGFSLLTANQSELNTEPIRDLAARRDKTVPQVVFRFALQVGIVPLTGTTSQKHMRQDLDCFEFELSPEEVRLVENIGL